MRSSYLGLLMGCVQNGRRRRSVSLCFFSDGKARTLRLHHGTADPALCWCPILVTDFEAIRPTRIESHFGFAKFELCAIPSKTDRRSAASSGPKVASKRSCAIPQYFAASFNLAMPSLVNAINRIRRSFGSVRSVINSSLSRGRRFCPNVDRSITNSSASSRTVGRSAPREFSSNRIPYWLDLSPVGASTVSYMSDNRRAAFFAAPALHWLILGSCLPSCGLFFSAVICSAAVLERSLFHMKGYPCILRSIATHKTKKRFLITCRQNAEADGVSRLGQRFIF